MTQIKPFLLLQLRPEDEAADNEWEAFVKFGRLEPSDLKRIRIDKEPLGVVDLAKYSGIIVGGGPSNVSDDEAKKPDNQKRFESELHKLLDRIVEQDYPFLGACYGIGILVKHLGGKVSKEKYGESAGAVTINVTNHGKKDKLTASLPSSFRAFAGHKEACQNIPDSVTLLCSNDDCPIQMVRYMNNVYAAQFHTELDQVGLALRINTYKHLGYFPPEDADMLIAQSKSENVTEPEKILSGFVKTYSKPI